MKLVWTESAAEQLESIYAFIKNKSETAAVEVYNDILDEADRLLLFPYISAVRTFVVGIC